MSFGSHINDVVTEFLETALVVDDEAFLHDLPNGAAAKPDEESVEVRSRQDLSLQIPDAPALSAAGRQHPLDTEALIEAFADRGVVCGVLAPLEGDQVRDRFLKAAARADLIILDWELHKDGGATARQLIKAILEQDADGASRRLRVIAIYTGQLRLKTIIEKIRKHLKFPPGAKQTDGMTLAHQNVRIVACAKPVEKQRRPELAALQVSETDLPARLASEFARLTDGLVPAVALAALAAIRNDTHRILGALRKDMDIGYLGHRAASSFPEDAEGHLVDVVVAEIGSVLADSHVASNAGIGVIRDWIAQARGAPELLDCGSALAAPKSFDEGQIEKILMVGLGLDENLGQHTARGLGEKELMKVRKQAAHLFTSDPGVADASANMFGMRMAVRTLYRRPRRVLRLGTIVLRRDEFMICVQPRCDSVRLTPGEPRGFPFLPLKVAKVQDPRHALVVENPDGSGLVRLQLQAKPFALKVIAFECGDARDVQAKLTRGTWAFHNTSRHRFVWVADLKPEFAQRVAVDLGAEIARVGLSESELVRLSTARRTSG